MNEFRPEPIYEKVANLMEQIDAITLKRTELTERVVWLNSEMAELNSLVKTSGQMDPQVYHGICCKQGQLRSEKKGYEKTLLELKVQFQKLSMEKDALNRKLKFFPLSKTKETLIEMRDKYTSFAADSTRVSSMRSMAAKFVEEILSIIKTLPE